MSNPEQFEDFVFLDPSTNRPFFIRQHGDGEIWLYYWHDNSKNFVTLRRMTQQQAEGFRQYALPTDQAALYFKDKKMPPPLFKQS